MSQDKKKFMQSLWTKNQTTYQQQQQNGTKKNHATSRDKKITRKNPKMIMNSIGWPLNPGCPRSCSSSLSIRLVWLGGPASIGWVWTHQSRSKMAPEVGKGLIKVNRWNHRWDIFCLLNQQKFRNYILKRVNEAMRLVILVTVVTFVAGVAVVKVVKKTKNLTCNSHCKARSHTQGSCNSSDTCDNCNSCDSCVSCENVTGVTVVKRTKDSTFYLHCRARCHTLDRCNTFWHLW